MDTVAIVVPGTLEGTVGRGKVVRGKVALGMVGRGRAAGAWGQA